MPQTNSVVGLTILQTDSNGYVCDGITTGLPSSLATAASMFAVGCQLVDSLTGIQWSNLGTVASPSWSSGSRTQLSTAAASKSLLATGATIATTSTTDAYMIVPETGTITSVDFSGIDALAASDSNYITWTITNLGQAGAGTTVVLAATNANTTKATGGTALAANTKRSLTLTSTAADLAVVVGDRLRIRATATGTLANTVTGPAYLVRFGGTT